MTAHPFERHASPPVVDHPIQGGRLVLTQDPELLARYRALVVDALVDNLGAAAPLWSSQEDAGESYTVVCLDRLGQVRGGFSLSDPEGGRFETLDRLEPGPGLPSDAALHALGRVGELTSLALDPSVRESVDLIDVADYAVDIAESLGMSHLLLTALAKPRAYHLMAHLFGFRRISPFAAVRRSGARRKGPQARAVVMLRQIDTSRPMPAETRQETLVQLMAATNRPIPGWRLGGSGRGPQHYARGFVAAPEPANLP